MDLYGMPGGVFHPKRELFVFQRRVFVPAKRLTDKQIEDGLQDLKHSIADLFGVDVRDARFCFAKVEQFDVEIDIEGSSHNWEVRTHTFETVADVLQNLSGCMNLEDQKPCLYLNGRTRALNPAVLLQRQVQDNHDVEVRQLERVHLGV